MKIATKLPADTVSDDESCQQLQFYQDFNPN